MRGSGSLGLVEAARFGPQEDWFVSSTHGGVPCLRAWAVAERLVDLFFALSGHLDPAVDVWLRDARAGRTWTGERLALPDVRAEIGRLRLPLASFGGVECSVYTAEDQLTITPDLLLVIYARTGRWSYLLDGFGLKERSEMPAPSWHAWSAPRAPAPPLADAMDAAVARLGLHAVSA